MLFFWFVHLTYLLFYLSKFSVPVLLPLVIFIILCSHFVFIWSVHFVHLVIDL